MTEKLPDASDLEAAFPSRVLPEGFELVRVHKYGRGEGPWYFGSGLGRFDLPKPWGTCYVADSVIAAIAESLGEIGHIAGGVRVVSSEALTCRRVRILQLPRRVLAADLTSGRAANFGADRMLSVELDRSRTQGWAALFHTAKFWGIVYETRRLAGSVSIALFGRSGERRGSEWKRGNGRKINESELIKLRDSVGIVVAPPVSQGELRPFIIA